MGEAVLVGGALSALVTDELDAAATILADVTAELNELVVVCRQRAEACRLALARQLEYDTAYADYETDLRQWQAAHDAHAADPGGARPWHAAETTAATVGRTRVGQPLTGVRP
jgi:hypothetical protein